jgi:hypothetical protein
MKRTANRFGVFLSYRREDASGHAGRLYDVLTQRFKDRRVFLDVDSIAPGRDFGEALTSALDGCSVVLALIGPGWSSAIGPDGRRRLENPNDVVRLELEFALQRQMLVIPVLLRGATMPSPEELPHSLAPLARCQAFELSDRLWRESTRALLDAIAQEEQHRNRVAPTSPPPTESTGPPSGAHSRAEPTERSKTTRRRSRSRLMAIVAALLAVAVVGGVAAIASDGSKGGSSKRDRNARDAAQLAADRAAIHRFFDGINAASAKSATDGVEALKSTYYYSIHVGSVKKYCDDFYSHSLPMSEDASGKIIYLPWNGFQLRYRLRDETLARVQSDSALQLVPDSRVYDIHSDTLFVANGKPEHTKNERLRVIVLNDGTVEALGTKALQCHA